MGNEIIELIEKGNDAFAEFKNDINDRLEVMEAKGSRPNFGGTSSKIANEWKSAFETLKANNFEAKLQMDVKTITSDGSGLNAPGILQPLVMTANTMSVFLSDFIPQRLIDGPSVVVNTLGSTDMAGIQASQGAAKHLLSASTTTQVIPLSTVADFMKVSVQSLQDIPDLQNIVQGVLSMRIKAQVSAMLYTTASTTGNYTAYTSTSTKAIDNIVGGVAVLANYGLTGTVFLNPADYATLVLTKASTAGMFLGLPQYEGLTIRQASVIPSGKFLISTTDGIGLGLAQHLSAMLVVGFENDDLTKNLRTVLNEIRVAPYVTDPNRVVIGNLVSGS